MRIDSNTAPKVGIIMLDTRFPRIKGDIGNPHTFDFPVLFKTVKEANPENIVLHPDEKLITPFIDAGLELVDRGACLITTSCGFLALFHQELSAALPVPVYTSSLLQIPLAQSILKPGQSVAVITAHKPSLGTSHFDAIRINPDKIPIIGMETAPEFSSVFLNGKTTLEKDRCALEMRAITRQLLTDHPEIGAIVLECTNMPPYADIVRQTSRVPVFDITTLLNFAYTTLVSRS